MSNLISKMHTICIIHTFELLFSLLNQGLSLENMYTIKMVIMHKTKNMIDLGVVQNASLSYLCSSLKLLKKRHNFAKFLSW